MAKNKENKRKESVIAKYIRVRSTLKQLCDDYGISSEEYMKRFQELNHERMTEMELFNYIGEVNEIIRNLIRELCFESWDKTIAKSFNESQQRGTVELIAATVQCDASNAYIHFSKIMKLLDMLNDESTKQRALLVLEDYCSSHSFEDLVNDYDLIFRSKYGKEASEARDRGFEKQKMFGKRKKKAYQSYFRSSDEKSAVEEGAPKQPYIG